MNTLIVGATLSGKSTAEAKKLTALALQTDRAIVVCDPHRDSLAFNFMRQLEGACQEHRVAYDRLADTDRVLGWTFLAPSRNSDPAQKQAENDERIRAFADVLLRRRGLQGLADKPLIEEWTTAALRLWMHQEKPIPLIQLPFVFHPRHPVFRHAVEHCTDEETTWKFRELPRLSATALRNEVAPAERLLASVCSSPAFRLRSGGTFDLEAFLDSKGILILEGGGEGLSEDAARTMFGAVILRVIQHVKRNPAYRSGRPACRVQLVLDEANNFHLVGPYEMRALAETQKMGLDIDVLVQALDFPTEEIRNGVLTNCARHEWFRCGSADVARMGAEDLLALLDPYKLHHREQRPRSRRR